MLCDVWELIWEGSVPGGVGCLNRLGLESSGGTFPHRSGGGSWDLSWGSQPEIQKRALFMCLELPRGMFASG